MESRTAHDTARKDPHVLHQVVKYRDGPVEIVRWVVLFAECGTERELKRKVR